MKDLAFDLEISICIFIIIWKHIYHKPWIINQNFEYNIYKIEINIMHTQLFFLSPSTFSPSHLSWRHWIFLHLLTSVGSAEYFSLFLGILGFIWIFGFLNWKISITWVFVIKNCRKNEKLTIKVLLLRRRGSTNDWVVKIFFENSQFLPPLWLEKILCSRRDQKMTELWKNLLLRSYLPLLT